MTVIILWLRIYQLLRPFKTLGPFIVIMTKVLRDIFRFTIIYLVVFIPFCISFWIMFGDVNIQNMETVDKLAFTIFRMILVDEYALDDMVARDPAMAYILIGMHFLLGSIIAINLMIALLSDSFQRVYDNAHAVANYQQALAIKNLEDFYLDAKIRQEFIVKLNSPKEPENGSSNSNFDKNHANLYPKSSEIIKYGYGNPLEEDYDDDEDTVDEGYGEMKKSSIRAVELLEEMYEKLGLNSDSESDSEDDDVALLAKNRPLNKPDKKIKLPSQRLDSLLNKNKNSKSFKNVVKAVKNTGLPSEKYDELNNKINTLSMQVNDLDNGLKEILRYVRQDR